MVRRSKQHERRSRTHHRPRPPALKTGRLPVEEKLKPVLNAIETAASNTTFIPKIK